LRTIVRVGLLDGPVQPNAALVNSREHDQLALEAATKGIILLKNEHNLLPLDFTQVKSIAVIGEAADNLQVGALGSPEVKPLHVTSLLEGINNRLGRILKVRYAPAATDGELVPGLAIRQPAGTNGFRAEYFKNKDLQGEPALVRLEDKVDIEPPDAPAPGMPTTQFSVRWTGKLVAPETGTYTFSFTGDDGFRVFLDDKPVIDHWAEGSATTVFGQADLKVGKSYDLRVEYFQNGGDFVAQFDWRRPNQTPYADAVRAATNCDVALVCVSTRHQESEGSDRPWMKLPGDQAALIRAVAAANHKTIVVLNNGTPVLMKDWVDHVPALLEAWFPGQEGGAALAAILAGDVNPSGKLPDTLAARREDYPDTANFPGADHQVKYAEDIFVGYRHFDRSGIEPLFPFGFGLSYTSFEYKNLKVSSPQLTPTNSVTVTVDVVNTGERPGEEVAELYIYDTYPRVTRPIRELKGFSKIALKPGETKTVAFKIKPRDLAYFDVADHAWKSNPGAYEIGIGASSRDLRVRAPLQLVGTYTDPIVALAR
jgi:beta-glucosidase